ncbi:energy transducer TonB [Rhodocyclus tenuis]|uniref:energy transducer TonB n=1 Tax=Rhodocyclus tenuis TaxID=1066 RepID=UPI001908CB3D|nr:TonB family protein [Rhodocyclus tenuis]MBK1681892.1 energy transducer TonB [Rhodocyclus tenuis]
MAALALRLPRPAVAGEHSLLGIAIGASVVLHAALLSLHFGFPEMSRVVQDKALEIVLVNSKSARRPTDSQALAQTNLDGGGDVEQDRRAKTSLPVSEQRKSGADLEQARQRQQQLETQQQKLLTQAKNKPVIAARPESEAQPKPNATLSGRDLAQSALAMARLEGEIAQNVDEYNKRPRKRNIGLRTDEYRFAQYVEDWRQKVERIGTLNYPDAARGKLYGSLVLTVTIRNDGSVEKIEINRSSGHRILDDAARRIVQMASPYSPFPPDIRRDTDILEITRAWSFVNGDSLQTAASR